MSILHEAPTVVGRLIVTTDEVDRATRRAFREELTAGIDAYLDAAREHGHDRLRPLVVDLGRVTFLDSNGVHVLIEADRRARARGGRLHLHGAAPVVEKVLDITGVWDRIHGDGAS